jgi:hypothetical protein
MRLKIALAACCLGFTSLLVLGQQTPASRSPDSRLITGRIMYVGHMSGGLDQWLIQDLRAWGRYEISPNSQGVDLTLYGYTPPRDVQPTRSEQLPIGRREKPRHVTSLTIQNWVTGQVLWRVQILMRKRKKDESVPAGPQTKIFARGMKPDQIAERCVTLLRQYDAQLESKEK